MSSANAPGVKVQEVSVLPPSVAAVATAIPAFIGNTQSGPSLAPTRITSMVDYDAIFGKPHKAAINIDTSGTTPVVTYPNSPALGTYKMFYALQLYFANGGGPCYIVRTGDYSGNNVTFGGLDAGIPALEKADEPTLLVFPDAQGLGDADYYTLMSNALAHCKKMGDRFTIMDTKTDASALRNNIVSTNSSYGAAYYPNLTTTLTYQYDESDVEIDSKNMNGLDLTDNGLYNTARNIISNQRIVMGPAAAIAGIYAQTDRNRGVWKAPANVALSSVIEPVVPITDDENGGLNIDATAGLSINAIRKFTGKGTLVWGARTLAGNDNEWRYVSVRRFFLMVEESVQKASGRYVFEPNSTNTWVQVKSMISNFLTNQWQAGALMGAKAEDAFYVKVGLGQTMTQQDVLEGKMIVEIGMAVVRPAEFVILRFSHKMLDA